MAPVTRRAKDVTSPPIRLLREWEPWPGPWILAPKGARVRNIPLSRCESGPRGDRPQSGAIGRSLSGVEGRPMVCRVAFRERGPFGIPDNFWRLAPQVSGALRAPGGMKGVEFDRRISPSSKAGSSW